LRLANQLTLPDDPDRVFNLLQDVERVAACMPGAPLRDKHGDVMSPKPSSPTSLSTSIARFAQRASINLKETWAADQIRVGEVTASLSAGRIAASLRAGARRTLPLPLSSLPRSGCC
jgi:hypothetical protein